MADPRRRPACGFESTGSSESSRARPTSSWRTIRASTTRRLSLPRCRTSCGSSPRNRSRRFPVLGWHLRRGGHLFVDRKHPDRAGILDAGARSSRRGCRSSSTPRGREAPTVTPRGSRRAASSWPSRPDCRIVPLAVNRHSAGHAQGPTEDRAGGRAAGRARSHPAAPDRESGPRATPRLWPNACAPSSLPKSRRGSSPPAESRKRTARPNAIITVSSHASDSCHCGPPAAPCGSAGETPKQFQTVGGRSILQRSVDAFATHPSIAEVIVAVPPELVDSPIQLAGAGSKPVRIIAGGPRRQDSVANAVQAAAAASDIIRHSRRGPALRVGCALISRTIEAAVKYGAALAATASRDTVKRVAGAATDGDRRVVETLPRDVIYLAQTPQAFRPRRAGRGVGGPARATARASPSEAALVERTGQWVQIVEGEASNIKITLPEDLIVADALAAAQLAWSRQAGENRARRHRLRPAPARRRTAPDSRRRDGSGKSRRARATLTPTWCATPSPTRFLAPACLGDIGRHFPDTDPAWQGASSIDMLSRATAIAAAAGFVVGNVDATIILRVAEDRAVRRGDAGCGRPVRLASMRDRVSIKGKTNEGVDAVGRGESDCGARDRAVEAPVRAPLRPQPDRSPPCRQRANRAVQLAARARVRGDVHPAHRGHRRRAFDAGIGNRHRPRPALAGARVGRGAGHRRRAGPYRQSERLHLYHVVREGAARRAGRHITASAPATQLEAERQAGASPPAGRPQYSGTCRDLSAPSTHSARIDAGRASRRPLSRPEPTRKWSSPTSCAGEVRFHTESHRRSGHRARRRTSRLQLRGRRRRCPDGDDACHQRRGPHLEHAAAAVCCTRRSGSRAPAFAHLVARPRTRSQSPSKRHGATSVAEFREKGYLPEALVNYLALHRMVAARRRQRRR